jgi:hypothetical protein
MLTRNLKSRSQLLVHLLRVLRPAPILLFLLLHSDTLFSLAVYFFFSHLQVDLAGSDLK